MSEEFKIVTQDKYFVNVAVSDYYGIRNDELELFVDIGIRPTVGHYITLFKKHYEVDVEIKNITPVMEFKVLYPKPQGIRVLIVTRVSRDWTYKPVTKY